MKKNLILLSICIYASISNVMAADVSHYVEFARVYGIVRYFSPNPYTQKWSESDWIKVCAMLANRAETQSLETVFKPLAPTLFFSVVPETGKEGTAFYKNSPFNYYYYSGSGELDIPFLAKVLSPGLAKYIPYYKKLSASNDSSSSAIVPVDGQYYSYEVSEDKYLNIQHSLQKEMFDRKATERLLKEAKQYWDSHQIEDNSIPKRRSVIFGLLSDKAVRVADLTVRWNIVRHFYPYFEDDQLDWECQLNNYMQEAIQMPAVNSLDSVLKWYNLICRFFNPIKDGHLFVRNNMVVSGMQSTYLPEFYASVETKLVNDTLLIRTSNDIDEPWRVCNSIDSQPVSVHMHNCRMITNAATDAHRDRIAAGKLFCASEYNTPFIVESCGLSGDTRLDTLYARLPEEPSFSQQTKPSVQKYDNGILYVDATSSDVNAKRVLSELAPDVKGLCFDLRGLPSLQFDDILAHLIVSDVNVPSSEVPINCFPFQENVTWRIGAETLTAKSPHIDLPVTFLCDASTVSWGETVLMIVRQYGLGEIIGQTTAGTTGDMTLFNLPLFPFTMTGMRMRCMDGKPHHAKGIVPDKIVTVYANDYLINFDRILNLALNVK